MVNLQVFSIILGFFSHILTYRMDQINAITAMQKNFARENCTISRSTCNTANKSSL